MPEMKPTPVWAYTSLACGILGWLAALPLPFLDYQSIAGATAGVGVIGPFLLGMWSALLGLLALILGIIGLAWTRSGRGMTWAGIALGGSLLMAYGVAACLLSGWW
jgi:hypothetical protein